MSFLRQIPDPAEGTDPAARIVDWFTILLASWTIYANVCVLTGVGFANIGRLALLTLPLAAALHAGVRFLSRYRLPTAPPTTDGRTDGRRTPPAIRALAAVAITAWYAWSEDFVSFWFASVAWLGFALFDGPSRDGREERDGSAPSPWTIAGLVLLVCLASAVTLVTHRPDQDDSFYLSVPVSALERPERAPLAQDAMFGEPDLPLLSEVYRVQSFELLVATCAWWTGLGVKTLYYLLFPAVFAALLVLIAWVSLRELGSPRPGLGATAVVLVTLAWGETHWGHGNFGFVRLFQGKAVLVSLGIPLIVGYAARFASRGDGGSWGFLALAQIGGMGLSANGIVIGPAAAAVVLLGSAATSANRMRLLAFGGLASAYVVAAGGVVAMSAGDAVESLASVPYGFGTAAFLEEVIGPGWRGDVALAALLSLPALPVVASRARLLAGWALATVVVLLNPLTSDLLEHVVLSMNWRIFWAIPFPLVIALVVSSLPDVGPNLGRVRMGALAAAAVVVGFLFAPEPWTFSSENEAWLGRPHFKVDPFHRLAGKAAREVGSQDKLLAPWVVAGWVPTFQDAPSLVEVREHYLDVVTRAEGDAAADRRRGLQSWVDTDAVVPARPSPKELATLLDEECVSAVLVDRTLPWRRMLVQVLASKGFQGRPLEIYRLFIRANPCAAPSGRAGQGPERRSPERRRPTN